MFIEVETWKKVVVLIIEVITSAATVIGIVRIMSTNLSQAITAIGEYRSLSMFSDETIQALPAWINVLRSAVLALGYWFLYVLINNFILKKWDFLTLAIVLLAAITSMTTGSRGNAFFMVISAIVMYLLLKKKQTGFRKGIRLKTFLIILMVLVLVLVNSQTIANLVGRGAEEMNPIEYISIYCGAQIMNLDTYLQGNMTPSNIWGGQTFINAVTWLGPILGLDIEHYELDLPFQRANGLNLGNVYTTFYPFIYDFGYIGVFVMTALMALISQWIYERAKRAAFKKTAAFSVILYCYISASIFFSFFSNKFYEQVCNIWFIRSIIIWWLSNMLFCRMHLKLGRKTRRMKEEVTTIGEKA